MKLTWLSNNHSFNLLKQTKYLLGESVSRLHCDKQPKFSKWTTNNITIYTFI
jgi:hypothetical protein